LFLRLMAVEHDRRTRPAVKGRVAARGRDLPRSAGDRLVRSTGAV